ncbi:MAG: thioredoxin-disulfide reductase [Bacteroidota bacterium]|nr:thioredoxin-disulfide reductase [Bacteroidota bacterium]
MNEIFDVIILGGGPAGLSAGIYTSRAKLKTLILNEGTTGGQVILTHEIANYPGVETVPGFQLVNIMKKQAKSFGCKIKANLNITKVDLESDIKEVEINNKTSYKAKSIIITSGGRPRNLGITGEEEYKGKGVSYCATCDGDFYTDREIVVIGGGNSALEEADSLTKYASKVTIIHQFNHFQATKTYIDKAKANEKISFIMESEPREIIGNKSVTKVKYENVKTGKFSEIETDGVFIFVGYVPGTEKFKNIIKLSERNEIITDAEMKTNINGVFAAGDCIKKRFKQVSTAVGDGTVAALSAIEYIN